jgi:hypothetical protein
MACASWADGSFGRTGVPRCSPGEPARSWRALHITLAYFNPRVAPFVIDRSCPNLNLSVPKYNSLLYKQGFVELKFLNEHPSVFIGPARLISIVLFCDDVIAID